MKLFKVSKIDIYLSINHSIVTMKPQELKERNRRKQELRAIESNQRSNKFTLYEMDELLKIRQEEQKEKTQFGAVVEAAYSKINKAEENLNQATGERFPLCGRKPLIEEAESLISQASYELGMKIGELSYIPKSDGYKECKKKLEVVKNRLYK